MTGDRYQELAPNLSQVGLALQYRQDRPLSPLNLTSVYILIIFFFSNIQRETLHLKRKTPLTNVYLNHLFFKKISKAKHYIQRGKHPHPLTIMFILIIFFFFFKYLKRNIVSKEENIPHPLYLLAQVMDRPVWYGVLLTVPLVILTWLEGLP